jgi:hypothetical protein
MTTRRDDLSGMLSSIQAQNTGFDDYEGRNTAFGAATRRFAAIGDAVAKLTQCVALEAPGDRRDQLDAILTRALALKDQELAELDAASAANAGYSDALARHQALLAAVASVKAALELEPRPRPVVPPPGSFTHGSP